MTRSNGQITTLTWKASIMRSSTFFIASAWMVSLAFSPQVHAAQQCDRDIYGQVYCAPKGGLLQKDAFGKYACSPGQCIRNDHGVLLCSAKKGGVVVSDPFKGIQCIGGCVQPHLKYCQRPK